MKQALLVVGALSVSTLGFVPQALAQAICEYNREECEQDAGEDYTGCINEPQPHMVCEGQYNVDMDACVDEYNACMDQHAGCAPCSSVYYTENEAFCGGNPEWDNCGCCLREESPIIIDLAGDGINFSSPENGPLFSINGGPRRRVAWPLTADDSWLAWDRSGNGIIDGAAELFGTVTPSLARTKFENGYQALRELDLNRDHKIDRHDAIFRILRLWSDANRNGLSEPWELRSLSDAGVGAIALDYKESKRTDEWGNKFRYRSRVDMANGAERRSVDVFPVSICAGKP